jgi:hypothetical protein
MGSVPESAQDVPGDAAALILSIYRYFNLFVKNNGFLAYYMFGILSPPAHHATAGLTLLQPGAA